MTQAEQIAALETDVATLKTQLSELDNWSDDVQTRLDSPDNPRDDNDRLTALEQNLTLLLDDYYGKNVRPAHFDYSTRIPDPDDLDAVAERRQAEADAARVSATDSTDQSEVDKLRAELAELRASLTQKG